MLKVSIIVPIYNVSQYIERCLLSIINQTYQNIEIVLVNDASPDDSILKAQKIIDQYVGLNVSIVTHDKNRGLSAARNTGVKASTGDYLFFLDSDDAIPENAVMLLIEKVFQYHVDLVVGAIDIVGASSKKYPSLNLSEEKIYYKSEILNSFLKKEWYEMACNKLIKRDLFFQKDCWFQEGIVHEDNLWSFQVAQCSHSMVVCKQPTYFYHIQPQSITQKKTERNFDSLCIVISKILESTDFINNKKTQYLLCTYLWELKIFCLKSLLKSNLSKDYIRYIYERLRLLYSNKLFYDFKKSTVLKVKENLLKGLYKLYK